MKHIKLYEEDPRYKNDTRNVEGFTYDQITFLRTHVEGGRLKEDKDGKMAYRYMEGTWTKNEDGTVDIDGSVIFEGYNYDSLKGLKFGTVNGNFKARKNLFRNLKDFPKKVTGYFDISDNQLESLEGAPIEVESFDCSDNYLETLEHCPEHIKGDFSCKMNKLKTLEHGPKTVGGHYNCSGNRLTSLEGCPERIEESFDCQDNELTSLKYGPEFVKHEYSAEFNYLTTLESGCNEVNDLTIQHNDVKVLVGIPKKIKGQFLYYFKYEDGRVEGFTINNRNPENGGWFDEYIMDDRYTMHVRRLIFSTLEAKEVNKMFKRYPGLTIMFLKELWYLDEYKEIKKDIIVPEKDKDNFDLMVGLRDLGF